MKKLPLLTAAAMAAGVAMLAPAEAKACDNCTDMNGAAMCKTEAGANFGVCTVFAIYDECGEETGTDCNVWFDASCGGVGPGWEGPWAFENYLCIFFMTGFCGS
jgi:hypothetical protein